MDPDTGMKLVAAYVITKETVGKILGPTAEYLGDELQQLTQRRVENLSRIFRNAEERLGDRINEEAQVPPRVLREILDEGSFADDELASDYFGGVLASSRTGVSRDDRGASFAKLVGDLSSYQLRSHYFFYTIFKEIFDGKNFRPTISGDLDRMQIFIPAEAFYVAIGISDGEDFNEILTHCLFGLRRLDLIHEFFSFGSGDHVKKSWDGAPGAGLLVRPSAFGIELFHWAHGLGNVSIFRFLDPELVFDSSIELDLGTGWSSTMQADESS